MNLREASVETPVAHAVVDADGRLLSADAAIEGLNEQAGGENGRTLAVPQLATVARLARRLGVVVTRRVTVADGEADVDLWVRAQPEGDHIHLAASGWTERPAWRPEPRVAMPVPDEAWRWETDAALRLTFVSLDAGTAHGFDPFSMLGRPLTTLFEFAEGRDGAMPILDALARRRPFTEQVAMLKPGGRQVMLCAQLRPDMFGAFAGLAGTARLVENDPAPAGTLPAGFTAGLDRALRGSLAQIVANADSISAQAEGPVADDYAAYAADIASAGRHLLGLVDDLVDLQAVERPDFAPAVEPIDLADIARRATGLLSVRASQMGVTIDRPGPATVAPARGDFRRTLQILVNLIGNASRYAPRGSRVLVEVRADRGMAEVAVADTGKGIAPEDQARIFDKFDRIDPAESGGSGLGLFIARRLARAMDGDLTVTSAPGEGARFTLSLPAGQAAGE